MSACPPTAAEKRTSPEVREVPKADSCTCKQRAEPRCENSISHKKSVEKKTVSIAGFLIYPSLWAIIVYGAVVHIRSVRPQANRALFLAGGSLFVSSRNSRGASEIKLARGSPTRETVSWSIKK